MTLTGSDPATGKPLAPPAARGRTTVSERAVATTAALVALDVAGAVAPPARFHRGREQARSRARVSGRLVRLHLSVGVRYPAPVRATTRAVREHVIREVGRLCDVDVREVDLDVVALPRQAPARRVR